MSVQKIGFSLLKIAKAGNTKMFLQFLERNKVLTNLDILPPMDTSQLIYSFSTLKIQDKRIWDGLEATFLSKERGMNIQDMVMCAGAFAKHTKNPKIWKAIEGNILENAGSVETRSIITLAHAFGHAKFQSPGIWHFIEEKCLEGLSSFGQKELAILTWSFSHLEQGSPKFWEKIELAIKSQIRTVSIQNLAIIAYGFSKLQKGNVQFWEALEKTVIKVLPVASGTKDWFKIQDLGNLVWAFANLRKGGHEYWENIEKAAIQNMHRYKAIDFANQAWSFIYSPCKANAFFNALTNQLKSKPELIEKSSPRELVLIGAALSKQGIENKEIWNILSKTFFKMLRAGAMNKEMFRARYHKSFFEINPSEWDEEVEGIYLDTLKKNSDNVEECIRCLYAISVAAFPKFGSVKFWEELVDLFIGKLHNTEIILKHEETRNRVASLIYTFYLRYAFERNVEMIKKLDSQFDLFYEDEKTFLQMTETKMTFILQLKAFVLRKNYSQNRKFWHYLTVHKDKFIQEMGSRDLRNLMFAVIINNAIFFASSMYDEYNQAVDDLLKESNEKDIRAMIEHLFTVLLTKYPNAELVLAAINKNPNLEKIHLEKYITSKSNEENQAEAQNGYNLMAMEYHNEREKERGSHTQQGYTDDEAYHP